MDLRRDRTVRFLPFWNGHDGPIRTSQHGQREVFARERRLTWGREDGTLLGMVDEREVRSPSSLDSTFGGSDQLVFTDMEAIHDPSQRTRDVIATELCGDIHAVERHDDRIHRHVVGYVDAD